jgi:hypothetical protein
MDIHLLRTISDDRALGASILFSHKHKHQSPPFHVNLMDAWRAKNELVVIEAFREGAKTTLSEEFMLMEAAFKNFNYALIFGETYTKACQRIEAIKHEILTNDKLHGLFGNLKGKIWSENKLVLTNGVALEAHGWEEEIRGYKHLDSRPDRAYLDDIENKALVRDTMTVDVNWKKLYLQLIPAMDKEGKIRMTGTPLADDCMIRRAAAAEDWAAFKFPICNGDIDDPQAESLWPDRYPMEWIRKKRDQYARNGMLREFMQEYMLVATGSQGKPFTEDMLRYADIAPHSWSPKKVIIDPARTVEVKTSDQTGHVTVSKMGTRIYVHRSGGEYWQPDQIVAGAFNMSRDADEAEVVIEKNSLDDWLLQPLRAMALMTGQHIDLKAVSAPQDRDKAAFIMGLRPFFVAGDIILVGGRAAHPQLVAQILNFPSGKRDILNALAYVLKVWAGVPVYPDFSAENICQQYVVARSTQLLLGLNATGSETAGVLVACEGRNMTVLADWVSPLMPNDAVPDMAQLVRAVYPGKQITCWVPADQFDQVGRSPLVSAAKAAQLKPQRGDTCVVARGSLSPIIRTGMNGRRMLLVDENARSTLNAIFGGYQFPVKSGGERMAEPERNSARTLIEALETLTSAVIKVNNAGPAVTTNAVNSTGTRYLSALPGR